MEVSKSSPYTQAEQPPAAGRSTELASKLADQQNHQENLENQQQVRPTEAQQAEQEGDRGIDTVQVEPIYDGKQSLEGGDNGADSSVKVDCEDTGMECVEGEESKAGNDDDSGSGMECVQEEESQAGNDADAASGMDCAEGEETKAGEETVDSDASMSRNVNPTGEVNVGAEGTKSSQAVGVSAEDIVDVLEEELIFRKNAQTLQGSETEQDKKTGVHVVDEPVPPPPVEPKRPPSAYFEFMNQMRATVVAENPGCKVGEISKELGARWKLLSEEEREPFLKASQKKKDVYKDELEEYRTKVAEYKKKYPNESTQQKAVVGSLPKANVAKLIKLGLDGQVKKCSKESVELVVKATEMFIQLLGDKVSKQYRSKKMLTYDMLQEYIETGPFWVQFLADDFPRRKKDATVAMKKRVQGDQPCVDTKNSLNAFFTGTQDRKDFNSDVPWLKTPHGSLSIAQTKSQSKKPERKRKSNGLQSVVGSAKAPKIVDASDDDMQVEDSLSSSKPEFVEKTPKCRVIDDSDDESAPGESVSVSENPFKKFMV